jgi:peptidoglycan/LPS O-acetylase OafA/YrhL
MNYLNKIATEQPHNRIDDIESLRAVAILLVLFEHLAILIWNDNSYYTATHRLLSGWPGVDLFFVISGFVISRSLLRRLNVGLSFLQIWQEISLFWMRRFWRIIPSAWLWLALTLMLTVTFNRNGSFERLNAGDAMSAFLQFANFHYYACNSAELDAVACSWILAPYWSLSMEEQFYLALPILWVLLRGRVATFLVALVLAQLFLIRPVWDLLWATRSDALALGVLLAIWSRRPSYQLFRPTFLDRPILRIPLVITLVLALMTLPTEEEFVPFYTGVLALVSAVMVTIASYDGDYIIRSRLLKPVFLWCGSRSYAIYLTHVPMFMLAHELWLRFDGAPVNGQFILAFEIMAAALVIVASELNYRLVERPFRAYGRRILAGIENRRSQLKARVMQQGVSTFVLEIKSPPAEMLPPTLPVS